MRLLSVNVGRPRLVQYNGQTISTAIYKEPVSGAVDVGELGLNTDDQADKRAHGGVTSGGASSLAIIPYRQVRLANT